MSELEKKYSDFQENECETQELIEPIDPKICPTCTPNPDFKLKDNWWEIEEGYLNEAVCEYHIRIYEGQAKREREEIRGKNVTLDSAEEALKAGSNRDIALSLGITNLLIDLDKPVNIQIKNQLIQAAYVKDQFLGTRSKELGAAYLIAVPAFNFDQIKPNDDEDAQSSDIENGDVDTDDQLILDIEGLNKKIIQLGQTLSLYQQYYSLIQKSSSSFVIRQKSDPSRRINYSNIIKRLNRFKSALNTILNDNNYPRVDRPGIFYPKRAQRIKFVFKSNGKPYELLKILALPDDGCNKYKKLKMDPSSDLRKPVMRVIYNLMANLGSVMNDMLAKDTMPWAEWTVKHIYPGYIIDYGNVEDIPSVRDGMECLIEAQLGIGNGKVIDSLTNEVMSAFSKIEEDMAEQACRDLQNRVEGGTTTKAKERSSKNMSLKEERRQQMLNRYTKEYINKFYKYSIEDLSVYRESLNLNESNLFSVMKKIGLQKIRFKTPEYNYKNKDPDSAPSYIDISNVDFLEKAAVDFATIKFANLEKGSFGNQISNSPHYADAQDAYRETIKGFESTYVDEAKKVIDGYRDIELSDFIPVIGLCGMSKIAGKALDCIANGVSFDAFLDILIEKTFDFMEVNTLSLFMNGLPADFREHLNSEIEKQFGPNVDLSDLFGIKNAEGGGQKMKDFVKSKQTARRILDLYKSKWVDGSVSVLRNSLPETDKEFIDNAIGPFTGSGALGSGPWNKIYDVMKDMGWDPKERSFNENGKVFKRKPGSEKTELKEYRPEKYVLAWIKYLKREHRKNSRDFKAAMKRVGSSVGKAWDATGDAIKAAPGNIAEGYGEFKEDRDRLSELRPLKSSTKKELEAHKTSFQAALKERDEAIADGSSLESGVSRASKMQELMKTHQNSYSEANKRLQEIQEEIDELNLVKQAAKATTDAVTSVVDAVSFEDTNAYEKAAASFEQTTLGTKVDAVFDIIFDFAIDVVKDFFSMDELFKILRSYPAVDFALDKMTNLLLKNCPSTDVIYPPPGDFLKGLKIDVCDPTAPLVIPKINIAPINYRFHIERQFGEIFRESITKSMTNIVVRMLQRLMSTLESSLCNMVETAGGLVASSIQDGGFQNIKNNFTDALNEAFCNDSNSDKTNRSKAEELADALFTPLTFSGNQGFQGSGSKVSNIISSVATTNELLGAMVAREGEEDSQFNRRISAAVTALAPEMESILGSPDQVAYFFSNLGSFLSPEDRERMRDLLDSNIPNLPVSEAICLTSDQLDEWNRLRENLLSDYPNPSEIVDDLNKKTEDALGDLMDDIGDLETDGPFIGSMINEALKDVCNENNLFNDVSQSRIDKQLQDELTDAFFDNISRSLIKGFTGRNSILGEAMADKLGKKEFGRRFFKIFNPNYQNSQYERDTKYNTKGRVGKLLMNITTENEEAIGIYPPTVGITQRNKILEEESKSYDFEKVKKGKKSSKNIVYRYRDELDNSVYRVSIASSNLRGPKKIFGYNLQVLEKVADESEFSELSVNIPVSISEEQNNLMKDMGFSYKENNEKDIRKEAFNAILSSRSGVSKNYDSIFEQVFKMVNMATIENLLTSEGGSIPNGYQFGYIDEKLTTESFEYTPSENEGELGTFKSPRIIPLDPNLYGGRHSNPPYYIEPRQFRGWLEIAVKAFESQDGCDPKTPALISFTDISNRTKMLASSMKNDPRLSQDPDCVGDKPFSLLLDSKNKAKLDGVVRTTIRSYLAEYFIKGYGLFSNIEITDDNFDSGLFQYLVSKMKSEMFELGTPFSSSKIRISREKYWYTFLEQCVETYQRTIDIDKVVPPDSVMSALNNIQLGLDRYVSVNRSIKARMKDLLKTTPSFKKPPSNFNPLVVVSQRPALFILQSVAHRLTTDPDKKMNFFNGETYSDISVGDVRVSSIKKLRFFQKIYFIRLYERESMLIMSELIREEFARFASILNDGLSDKPYYKDLSKSLLGMQEVFPSSTVRVGTNTYINEKQANGSADPGDIPNVKSTQAISPETPDINQAKFIIEKYARIKDKPDGSSIQAIDGRSDRYRGVVSLEDLSDFIDLNISQLEGKKISDVFGSLSFLYKGSFKGLMADGNANNASIKRLAELNQGTDINIALLQNSLMSHVSSRDYVDFHVLYDESFISGKSKVDPDSTIGESGISYGLRISLMLPAGYLGDEVNSIPQISKLSSLEKSYRFADGGFVIPLISNEIDVIDGLFDQFDPFSGIQRYDLECLVSKITKDPGFDLLFSKILNMKQASSMLAIYCIETLVPSIGRDESERYTPDLIADVEDSWDGTINKFAKNFLRREFKSIYLANTPDGQSVDDDDSERGRLLSFGNPFDQFALPAVKIPWWYKRRLQTKIYDRNRVECADPKKDLE